LVFAWEPAVGTPEAAVVGTRFARRLERTFVSEVVGWLVVPQSMLSIKALVVD
jgi:hypothetical protein